MKQFLLALAFVLFLFQSKSNAQTNLISASDGGFETGTTFAANGWTVVNSAPLQTNQWFCAATGTTGFLGARCAFVGTAANNNNYNNVASVSHIYRDITFPPGQTEITLSFRWKVRGRSNEDYMMLYLGSTAVTPSAGVIYNNGQIGTEYRNQTTWAVETITLTCDLAATTKRLVFSWVNDGGQNNNPAIALDNISITTASLGTCESLLGLGVFPVASLPYNSGAGTTCGYDNDIKANNSSVCGDPLYYGDEDVVWVFTPTTSGQVAIDLNAPVAVSTGLMLYDGCPYQTCDLSPSNCVAQAQDISGNKSMCVPVIANHTYYLVLDGNATCNNYDNLYISLPNTNIIGNTCANPQVIDAFPLHLINESTACMGDDYNNATAGSCGNIFESGEDKVYRYDAIGPECLSIVISNASTSNIGFSVYSGCPGAGGFCIASYGGGNPLVTNVTLPNAGTYYIIVDSWAPPAAVSYDLVILSYGDAIVMNDEPCNAQEIQVGLTTFGDNNCSTGNNEPSLPTCWLSPGILNTVWFAVQVPASGNLYISTQTITLLNTQIAVYTGDCSSLFQIACNDDINAFNTASQVSISGLIPGEYVFISVDGFADQVGTFNILATEGIVGGAYNQQDCLGAISVCSQVMVSPTSFFGPGLIEEIPLPGNISNPSANPAGYNSGCLLSGERNIVWYAINITSAGDLKWTLNHLPGCYDWIMFDLTNNTCDDILNNTLPPVRCNWNGACLTSAGMMDVIPVGGSPFDFQAPLAVTAGQHFVLALSNWSGTSGNFSLDFSSSTCGIGGTGTSNMNWTGATGSDWNDAFNWGGCSIPGCGISSNIFPSQNAPIVVSEAMVQDMNILPGASITLMPYATLRICGDFTNLGVINADSTSIIVMNNDTVTQHFSGSFVQNNRIGSLYIGKTGGAVIFDKDMEIAGDITLENETSVLNTNGRNVTLRGNLFNAAGNLTYKNTGPQGSLNLTGYTDQMLGLNGDLTLTHLRIEKPAGNAGFIGGNLSLDSNGTLQLIKGKLTTLSYELILNRTSEDAIVGGDTTSYVEGYLRRKLSGQPGIYEFPVGNIDKGFQRAQIEFTTPTSIPDLLANFTNYGYLPLGPTGVDCFNYEYNATPVLDNGYWNIHASANPDSGFYNVTLFSRLAAPLSPYATVVKSAIEPPDETSWELVGECDLNSTYLAARRNGLRGFSSFGIGQSNNAPLPITLVDFSGKENGRENLLEWTTASEHNSNYYQLESSYDGQHFEFLSQQSAAGNSTTNIQYTDIDAQPKNITYYRLKSVDMNGEFTYSEIIVIVRQHHALQFSAAPNPTHDKSLVLFQTEQAENASLQLFNSSGALISELFNGNTGKELHSIQVDCSSLNKGVYYYRLLSEGKSETIRLVVL